MPGKAVSSPSAYQDQLIGALLTLGLVRRCGEVFPRWVPGLRGRRVPVGLALVPGYLVPALLAPAGLMFIRLALTGTRAVREDR